MHILVFNQHHHNPDCAATCRHYTLLEFLARRHRVTLVSSDAWKQIRITEQYPWVPAGVENIEVKMPYSNKMGVAERLWSYGGYAAMALWHGLHLPKPDVIWGVSTPLSTPWVAAKVAAFKNVPWVFEVQDLWPSFPIEMGAIKQPHLKKLLYHQELNLYRSAAHTVTLSPDMTTYVLQKGIPPAKVSTLLNGTDLNFAQASEQQDLEKLRQQYGIGNRRVVLYAGTYGRANDVVTLLQAARLMQHDPQVCFVFTGNGYLEDEIKKAAAACDNIIMLPPQPRHQIFNWFRLASVAMAGFINKPVLATNSPAKFYDSLAVGTPVIVTNPGWTKRLVEEYNCGWYVPSEQPEPLANLLRRILHNPEQLQLFGLNGQQVARQQFDRQEIARQFEVIFEQVVRERG